MANLNVRNANRSQRLATAAKAIAVTQRLIQSRIKMSIVSSLDFWIQSVASLFAVVNIWLLANGQIKLGCQIGLFGQLIFIYIFIDSQQYPLLLTDAILFGVYVKKLLQIKHYKHRRIQL
tara:strand:- start:170 stop:529 length:360 start_codon:yes stop_codon:yes gene_type:complete